MTTVSDRFKKAIAALADVVPGIPEAKALRNAFAALADAPDVDRMIAESNGDFLFELAQRIAAHDNRIAALAGAVDAWQLVADAIRTSRISSTEQQRWIRNITLNLIDLEETEERSKGLLIRTASGLDDVHYSTLGLLAVRVHVTTTSGEVLRMIESPEDEPDLYEQLGGKHGGYFQVPGTNVRGVGVMWAAATSVERVAARLRLDVDIATKVFRDLELLGLAEVRGDPDERVAYCALAAFGARFLVLTFDPAPNSRTPGVA